MDSEKYEWMMYYAGPLFEFWRKIKPLKRGKNESSHFDKFLTYSAVHSRDSNSPNSGNSCISEQVMNDQFVLLINKSYLNSGLFTADQTFHYCESTLYLSKFF